jgi:membrane protein
MNQKPDPYGRDAARPYHIPLKGWWQVAQRVWSESARDNLSVVAAGCAFFALAAIFPALSALILLYGLSADPAMWSSTSASLVRFFRLKLMRL